MTDNFAGRFDEFEDRPRGAGGANDNGVPPPVNDNDTRAGIVVAVAENSLDAIAHQFPLPTPPGTLLEYQKTNAGEVFAYHQRQDKNERVYWKMISSPFSIPARTRYLDRDEACGLRIVVRDMNGVPRNIDIRREMLAKSGGGDVRANLYNAGLRFYGDGEQTIMAVLKAVNPLTEIVIVDRPGWHKIDADRVFVTPAGIAVGTPAGFAIELAVDAVRGRSRGHIAGWQAAVIAAAMVDGCPHFLIGIVAGFAGPVLSLAGMDTCGINLSGMSSGGKTTAQRLSVSPWSPTDVGAGLLHSMRSTDNAVEAIAQGASGTILAMDELAHADGRDVAKLIYTLAGNQGKARMTSDATLKARYGWRTYVVLSSECSLQEKVCGDRTAWTAGMAARFVDVDITDVNRAVPGETLTAIREIDNHCGLAGPLFLEALIANGFAKDPSALRDRITQAGRVLAGQGADSARIRAATCLAVLIVAGDLARRFGILPACVDVERAVQWAWDRFDRSPDAVALKPEDQAIAAIRGYIAERWDVTVKRIGGADNNNRETVAWYDDHNVYLPVHRAREAAGETQKSLALGKILKDHDLIAYRADERRIAVRNIPGIGKIDAYALKRSEFGRPEKPF